MTKYIKPIIAATVVIAGVLFLATNLGYTTNDITPHGTLSAAKILNGLAHIK